MKKTILLPCFLLGGLSVMAQSNHLNPFNPSVKTKHQKLVNALLAQQSAATAQKGTNAQQRVIAQTSIGEDLAVEDTMTYKYSGTRSSKYNHNKLDLTYNMEYSSDYIPAPALGIQTISKDLLADSMTYYSDGEAEDNGFAYYRTDNTTDSFIDVYHDNTTDYTTKTLHSFNSNSYLTKAIILNNYNTGGTTLDTAQMTKYFYNTTNTQLTTDTVFLLGVVNLIPYYSNKYHYNTQNLLDSITTYTNSTAGYDVEKIVSIQYTSTGKVQKVTDIDISDNVVSTVKIDTFGYTGTLPFFTFYQNTYSDMNMGGGVDSYRLVRHIGTNNLPDTALYQSANNGAWSTETKGIYYYNGYNNPDSVIGLNDDGSFAGRFDFYYEIYDDGISSIHDIKNNNDFNLYPNPFSNKINIEWKASTTNEAKIALVNIIGQTVYSTKQTLVKGNNVFNIPNINSGNYILLIQDAKGNMWKSKMVKN